MNGEKFGKHYTINSKKNPKKFMSDTTLKNFTLAVKLK